MLGEISAAILNDIIQSAKRTPEFVIVTIPADGLAAFRVRVSAGTVIA